MAAGRGGNVYRPIVLCYHAVSSSWPSSLAVSEQLLERHVTALRRRGYVGITLAQAERARQEGTLPRRSVVVTFDDAYASVLRARPILDAASYPGTVFVVTRFAESGEPLRWPGIDMWSDGEHADELEPLGWGELEALRDAGWEVGSHTVSHPRLPDLDDETLRAELTDSRAAIVRHLGSCETIAYPYGLADARVAAAARDAGYLAAVTLTTLHGSDEPYLRPRAGMYPSDAGWRARVKLSPTFAAARRSRRLGPLLARFASD
jgi:peptidoglycan/xylan/chitin deacetylase (PgdA/CDA1 family)